MAENTIEDHCKSKFARLSNKQLVSRINNAPDFGYDDESVELSRRIKTSKGKFDVKMQGNTLVILQDL